MNKYRRFVVSVAPPIVDLYLIEPNGRTGPKAGRLATVDAAAHVRSLEVRKHSQAGRMSALVYVYGTLKEGGRLHEVIRPFIVHGPEPAYTHHRMVDDRCGYPFLINEPGMSRGELYTVDTDALKTLDRVEGVPFLYTREKLEVHTLHGETLQAFVYVASPETVERFHQPQTILNFEGPIGRR